MDGIPVIAIDPKGDILATLLLTFPELCSFICLWVDEDEARREGLSVEQLANGKRPPGNVDCKRAVKRLNASKSSSKMRNGYLLLTSVRRHSRTRVSILQF
ncbi:MAG: hypothetical protein IPI39_18435 [Candidatus Obscuribacter sp.]|nr:hypothetical protein [Candidatus Obscuribacter sp.]